MTKKAVKLQSENPVLPETPRKQRLGRVYSLKLDENIEKIFISKHIQKYRTFSAFLRDMIERGMDTLDIVGSTNTISSGVGDTHE